MNELKTEQLRAQLHAELEELWRQVVQVEPGSLEFIRISTEAFKRINQLLDLE